ncbi:hypothetical protein K443DRAFT_293764 [Laccaria amethystina LaAM-08-1]|uniref:Uncharacterized protein n=1 Tax=Laccaria amethystina LaAM-08-1 TaxID=1095629 RepID=A0A0C9X4J5_9AGAR|nr:hypothetical protein K443DRAFT_293764 [Laccaria amethystina LaAM-08-1]
MSSRPFHQSDMFSKRPLTPLSMMCFHTRIICDLCSCLRRGPMFRLVRYGQSMVPSLSRSLPSRYGRCLVSPPLPLDTFMPEASFQIDPLRSTTPHRSNLYLGSNRTVKEFPGYVVAAFQELIVGLPADWSACIYFLDFELTF